MTIAIRMALRQFRQHPSFALITILVLGLGVGANDYLHDRRVGGAQASAL